MGEFHRKGRLLLLSCAIIGGSITAHGAEDDPPGGDPAECGDKLTARPNKRKRTPAGVTKIRRGETGSAAAAPAPVAAEPEPAIARAEEAAAAAVDYANFFTGETYTLDSFFEPDPERNIALKHPFVLANAAEKAYALVTHKPAREALDPMYRRKRIKVYPMLAGEDPASGGRMVVGQESAVHTFVQFLRSAARGDRVGKSIGFPGPAGTGKTELLYVIDQLERNLGKLDKYRTFSYRFKGLYRIPKLRDLTKFVDDGTGNLIPVHEYFNPDLARSPFTLLQAKTQQRLLAELAPRVKGLHGVMITRGWSEPEPKTREIIKFIFEHRFPQLQQGIGRIEDIPEDIYRQVLSEFIAIVPRDQVKPPSYEARVIAAQSDNPNETSLYTSYDMARIPKFGKESALSVSYTGEIFQQDGQLLMFDEYFRNDPALLNKQLETIQNHTVQGEVGMRVHLDVLPVWNSNDESIADAKEKGAIKALLDRTDAPPMRSLMQPNQIEAIIPFQIGLDRFRMRPLGDGDSKLETQPFRHAEVYPAVDAHGNTETARGRYALYFDNEGVEYLIAPYTLNFIAWVASATRAVVDEEKIKKFADQIDLVGANREVLYDEINRVRTMIGDQTVEPVHRGTLLAVHSMTKEGAGGITSRDIETWTQEMITLASDSGAHVITPRIANQALVNLLQDPTRLDPGSENLRLRWSLIRRRVAETMLLPKLRDDVRTIISNESNRAERIYDNIVDEMLLMADGGEGRSPAQLGVNITRLNKVKEIYKRVTGGREFHLALITRLLKESGGGPREKRSQELLQAVKEMLAEQDRVTADHIADFDQYFRGGENNPAMRQKMADVSDTLSAYGYDRASFEDTVKLVAQLDADIERQKLQRMAR